MKIIFLTFGLILFAAGAGFAQSDKQKTQIAEDVRQVLDEQTAAWNRGDIGGFMRGYWNSPELIFVSGNNVTKGWQPTLDRYQKNYDSREKMGALSFSELETIVTSKDSAIVLGRFTLVRQSDKPTGMFTLNFRRFKEGWRIILDHTS